MQVTKLRSAFDSKFCKLLGRTENDKQNDLEGETSTVIATMTQFFTLILSHKDINSDKIVTKEHLSVVPIQIVEDNILSTTSHRFSKCCKY